MDSLKNHITKQLSVVQYFRIETQKRQRMIINEHEKKMFERHIRLPQNNGTQQHIQSKSQNKKCKRKINFHRINDEAIYVQYVVNHSLDFVESAKRINLMYFHFH